MGRNIDTQIKTVNAIVFNCTLENGKQANLIVDPSLTKDVFIEYLKGLEDQFLTVHVEGNFKWRLETVD